MKTFALLAGALASAAASAQPVIVNSTADSGPGSLRQAINDVNVGLANAINFNLSTGDAGFNPAGTPGGWRISLLSALPTLSRTATINALTQPGAACGTPKVELRPSGNTTIPAGLTISASNCDVRGLCMNGFSEHGLLLSGATGATIACCIIGADITGGPTIGNEFGITILNGASNTIGSPTAGLGNLIAGNRRVGVSIVATGAPSNLGNAILGNAIRDNGGLGIDLGNNGVTANDPLDLDVGPNHFQNYPSIDGYDGTMISASLGSLPNRRFRIEFFGSPSADPSNFGEGAKFLGATEVTSSAAGAASVSFPYVATSDVRVLTATATSLPPLRGPGLSADGADLQDRGTAPPPPIGTSEFSHTFAIGGPPNTLPVARDDAYSTAEDTPLSVGLVSAGVLGNDTDVEPGMLLAQLVAAPTRGSLTLNADGTLSYLPNPNFYGVDSFTYRAIDVEGGQSAPATVRITVTPVNDAPFAVDDDYETDEDTPLVLANAAEGVLRNDIDAELDPLTASLVSPPLSGTVMLSASGTFTYTPAANFAGIDSFTYRARDAMLDSGPATVTIAVRGGNDPPVALDDSYTTNEDTPLTVSTVPLGVLGNDTDPDLPPPTLTATLISTTTRGTLVFNTNGTFTYSPQPNFNGIDSFTYRASDGMSSSAVATATITVRAVNDAPVARNDSFFTNEDTALNVPAPGVLLNDGDVDDPVNTLMVTIIGGPSNGVLANVSGGGFRYTPSADFSGNDQFTYRLTDAGGANSNVATVVIQVIAQNDAPIARDDTFTTSEDSALTVPPAGVLANDSDADVPAQTLTAVLISPPSPAATAAFTLNPSGAFTFSPAPDFNGPVTFSYQASDGAANSNAATVTINVQPINDAPVARDDAYLADANTILNISSSTGVLTNDTDVDTPIAQLTAAAATLPAHGSLTLAAGGGFQYAPAADYAGPDAFTYRAFDGAAESNVATVNITVRGGANQPPIARCRDVVIDARTTCPTSFSIVPADVDGGSSDPDDARDTLTFSVSPSGPFAPGRTTVTLSVTDPGGRSSTCTATVTVLVTDCNGNGQPDACEIAQGTLSDCDHDGVPDACQCLWENGAAVNGGGRMSQIGGRHQVVSKAADDFYLEPDRIYHLTSLTGQMFSSASSTATRYQVELFTDCDGAPSGRPFASFDRPIVTADPPGPDGLAIVTCTFDLCDKALWLEGGQTYWVSFSALLACDDRGEVFWAMSGRDILGSPPRTARGTPSPYQCSTVVFDPWLPIETCCGLQAGCRNLAFKLGGSSCPLIWDNGPYRHCPGGGGYPSGRSGGFTARSADNFVLRPCVDQSLCFIEATIWTNGDPSTGFIEIYDQDCNVPAARLFAGPATRAIPLNETIQIGPHTVHAYTLQLIEPGWRLAGGRTYWLSAGISNQGGSLIARSYFALADRCSGGCDVRISPAWTTNVGGRGEVMWCRQAEDLAFRIFARDAAPASPVIVGAHTEAHCRLDLDASGSVGLQDLFDFIAAWMAGCP